MPRIIAFGHRKRVGKDSAVSFALSHLRLNFKNIQSCRVSFGDQLKRVSAEMFGWAGLQEAVYYVNHPEQREIPLSIGLTPRQIWDEMGTFGQALYPPVWPEMALGKAKGDLFLIPDLRRSIEVDYVRKHNGLCIRIDRDEAPISNHIVDTSLADYTGWDRIIKNNTSLKDLNFQVKALLDETLISWGMA